MVKLNSEEAEQIALVEYLEILKKQGKITLFTAIPQNVNNVRFAMRNKRLGVRPGFPDLIILSKRYLLFLELKRKKNAHISPEQVAWITELSTYPFVNAVICKGFDEAKKVIDAYFT